MRKLLIGLSLCMGCSSAVSPSNDGGTEPTYSALTMSYRTADPKFIVTGDGATLTTVGAKTLAALNALAWDLSIKSGNTQVVVAAGSSSVLNGVSYAASICSDFVSSLSGCSGDLACWNNKATVPTGALPFVCQKANSTGQCTAGDPPAGLFLTATPLNLKTSQGNVLATIRSVDDNTMEIGALDTSVPSGDSVNLTRSGTVTDNNPQNGFDVKPSLDNLRTAINTHGAWAYSESMCTGSVTHTSCNAVTDAFDKCIAAVVDGATAGPCFDAVALVHSAIGTNPDGYEAICM